MRLALSIAHAASSRLGAREGPLDENKILHKDYSIPLNHDPTNVQPVL